MPHAAERRWPTVWHFLCERLPVIAPAAWRARLLAGAVLDAQGQALPPDAPCQSQVLLWYWRQVDDEPDLPVTVEVLFQDEHLVVADKPHGMAISPKGRHARETVQARLQRQLGLHSLSPIHRLDRETAGVVVFSVRPAERQAYHDLFSQRAVQKIYEAVAPWRGEVQFPLQRCSRIVPGDGPMQMVEVDGEVNAITHIDTADHQGDWALYRLRPHTGRTHQLRVHMLALGLPLRHDRIYPVLWPQEAPGALPELDQPLQLLARDIAFVDPVTGAARHFSSRRHLAWPPASGAIPALAPASASASAAAGPMAGQAMFASAQVLPRGSKV